MFVAPSWNYDANGGTGAWDVLYYEWNGHSGAAGVEKGASLEPAHTSSTGEVKIRFYGQHNDTTSWDHILAFITVNHGLLSWQSIYYADFAAMHSALQAGTARFVDQHISDEEVIDDETGLALAAYADEGIYIRGITNIASLGSGQLEFDVLGYFPEWSYEPPD